VSRWVFADSSFYVALLLPRDRFYEQARQIERDSSFHIRTTEFVLCEVGNFFSAGGRAEFLELVSLLRTSPFVRISPASRRLYQAGLDVYADRRDKEWSLTDCISIAEMKRLGIRDALTNDHHFVQAGFKVMMR
jgi:predicted nucleic acid-binding protein